MSNRWYAVHAKPSREQLAKEQLKAQEFETFLPSRLKTVTRRRKLTTVVAPFFSRYLFVRLNLTRDRWRSVNGTIGVNSLVMFGDQPQPLPFGVVEAMIASADSTGLVHLEQSLAVGSRVRLLAGPFADQLGILDRVDDSGRVRVLLKIMNSQVPVQVSRKLVMAVLSPTLADEPVFANP